MPHQCTSCGRTFPDGSKQMLSGCPGCGGNKFQFLPASTVDEPPETPTDAHPVPANPTDADSGSDVIDTDAEAAIPEDRAQASARSAVVSADELPPVESSVDPPDADDRPDLARLREELNQQFESIKIVEPGQYELNLMELYDREEYIIAIEEDGRYVIDVPTMEFDEPGQQDE